MPRELVWGPWDREAVEKYPEGLPRLVHWLSLKLKAHPFYLLPKAPLSGLSEPSFQLPRLPTELLFRCPHLAEPLRMMVDQHLGQLVALVDQR